MQYAHYRDVPESIWRWPNFSPAEIACGGSDAVLINEDAMDKLQYARDLSPAPFRLNSAYRSPAHNKAVGGAINSRHLNGSGFDINLAGHDKNELLRILKIAGFTGFGSYDTFIHVDSGLARSWTG